MAGLVRPPWTILSGMGKEEGMEGRRMFLEQPHICCLFLFENLTKFVRINHHNKLLLDMSLKEKLFATIL